MFGHVDIDAFFASVLQRKHPKLKGLPLLALGMGGGCVIAASYEAKAKGVVTGMPFKDAKKLCPEAHSMPSDFDEALRASREIEDILKNHVPFMERYSVDEWFLDMKSLPKCHKDMAKWAEDTQQEILRKTHLTASFGIGPSKLLSKMASEYVKPAGFTMIGKHLSLEAFLKDRVIEAIPGIGKRRGLHSAAHGWETAYDFINAPTETVIRLFGKPGHEMQRELRGDAIWTLESTRALPKSISRCRSFRPTRDKDVVFSMLLHHLVYTVMKMRRDKLCCKAIYLWLRNGDYKSKSTDTKLSQPANTEEQLMPYIKERFGKIYDPLQTYTQVGLGLVGLKPSAAKQYSLFESPEKMNEDEEIQKAMDKLHKDYGRDSLLRAAALPTKQERKPRVYAINE